MNTDAELELMHGRGHRHKNDIDKMSFYRWITEITYILGAYEGNDSKGRSFTVGNLEVVSQGMHLYIDTFYGRHSYVSLRISIDKYATRNNNLTFYHERVNEDTDRDVVSQKLVALCQDIFRHIKVMSEIRKCSKAFRDGCGGRLVAIGTGKSACRACEEIFQKHGESRQADNSGYVYIAGNIDIGIYKIGFSVNPDHRLHAIRKQVPFDVSIIHTIATNEKGIVEKLLHVSFREHRLNGEWFKLPLDQINVMLNVERIDFSGNRNKDLSITYLNNDETKITINEMGNFSISDKPKPAQSKQMAMIE